MSEPRPPVEPPLEGAPPRGRAPAVRAPRPGAGLVSGAVRAFSSRAAGAGASLGLSLVLAHALGAAGAGTFYLVLTCVTIAATAARLGLDQLVLRRAAEAHARGDAAEVRALDGAALAAALPVALATAVLLALGAGPFARALGKPDVVPALRALAPAVVPLALVFLRGELLRALGRPGACQLLQTAAPPAAALALLAATLPFARASATSAALAYSAGAVLAALAAAVAWRRARPAARDAAPVARRASQAGATDADARAGAGLDRAGASGVPDARRASDAGATDAVVHTGMEIGRPGAGERQGLRRDPDAEAKHAGARAGDGARARALAARGARPGPRELARAGLPFLAVALLALALQGTSLLALGALGTPEDVGVFSIAYRVASLATFALVAVNASAAPRFAALAAAGERELLARTAARAAATATLLALPLLVACVVFPAAVLACFGEAFAAGAPALVVLALGQLVNVATGSVGCLLLMSGRERLLRANTLLALLASVALHAWLVPAHGVLGAAAANALSLALLNLGAALLVRRSLDVAVFPFAFRVRAGAARA